MAGGRGAVKSGGPCVSCVLTVFSRQTLSMGNSSERTWLGALCFLYLCVCFSWCWWICWGLSCSICCFEGACYFSNWSLSGARRGKHSLLYRTPLPSPLFFSLFYPSTLLLCSLNLNTCFSGLYPCDGSNQKGEMKDTKREMNVREGSRKIGCGSLYFLRLPTGT